MRSVTGLRTTRSCGELVPKSAPKRIAIVGGGFSGVMTAVNLARLSTRPLQVTVINYRRPAGRGVAYGTRRPEHLLNVAARNMSAFRDEPDHFLRWLRTRSEFDTMPEIELRERFMPRMVYGDYLRSIMHHHLQSAGGMTPRGPGRRTTTTKTPTATTASSGSRGNRGATAAWPAARTFRCERTSARTGLRGPR